MADKTFGRSLYNCDFDGNKVRYMYYTILYNYAAILLYDCLYTKLCTCP